MAAIEVREHCGGAQEKGDQFTKFQLWLTITVNSSFRAGRRSEKVY
jgi:hypothetical protein